MKGKEKIAVAATGRDPDLRFLKSIMVGPARGVTKNTKHAAWDHVKVSERELGISISASTQGTFS